MSEEQKGEKRFEVKDRRRFTETGEHRTQEPAQPAGEAAPAGQAEQQKTGEPRTGPEQPEGQREEARSGPLPEINFSTFIVSLSGSALIHLGMAPDPITGKTNKDTALAKQTIDLIGMLQEKTRGNLTQEEEQLLKNMLYDLRMHYVEATKAGG